MIFFWPVFKRKTPPVRPWKNTGTRSWNSSTIGRFRTDLEAELLQLRRELLTQTYTPGSYRETIITRPKRRMISAAPFRDRVVHHALCNVVMPLFERKMMFDL